MCPFHSHPLYAHFYGEDYSGDLSGIQNISVVFRWKKTNSKLQRKEYNLFIKINTLTCNNLFPTGNKVINSTFIKVLIYRVENFPWPLRFWGTSERSVAQRHWLTTNDTIVRDCCKTATFHHSLIHRQEVILVDGDEAALKKVQAFELLCMCPLMRYSFVSLYTFPRQCKRKRIVSSLTVKLSANMSQVWVESSSIASCNSSINDIWPSCSQCIFQRLIASSQFAQFHELVKILTQLSTKAWQIFWTACKTFISNLNSYNTQTRIMHFGVLLFAHIFLLLLDNFSTSLYIWWLCIKYW